MGIFYHIAAPLEERFSSVENAVAYYQDKEFTPRIPASRMSDEDSTTPRVCVCKELKDCFAGLCLLGIFRRCLAANEDAKSYETDGLEVYPVIVCEFSDDVEHIFPSQLQVPDVNVTNEIWITESVKPINVYVKWLHMRSIIWDDYDFEARAYPAKEVSFIEPGPKHKHPWLNGFGNNLNSSEEEIPWCFLQEEAE